MDTKQEETKLRELSLDQTHEERRAVADSNLRVTCN